MYLSYLKSFLFFIALSMTCFVVSCENPFEDDNEVEKTQNFLSSMFYDDDEVDDDDDHGDYEDCFHFIYPLSIAYPDGTETAYDNEDSLWIAIELWYKESSFTDSVEPMIIFPIEVELYNDEKITVSSDEELYELFESCVVKWEDEEWDDHEWDDDDIDWGECDFDELEEWVVDGLADCFEVQYPLSVLVDSTTYTFNSEEEISGWVDSLEVIFDGVDLEDLHIALSFPITVIDLETNETITIENEEGIAALVLRCEIQNLCFDFNYPITLLLDGGDTHVVNSDEELIEKLIILGTDYFDNDEVYFVPMLPISITFDNGDSWEINDLEKLERAFEECED